MINLRKNKLLFFLILFSVFFFIIGFLFYFFIGDSSKEIITNNINLLINNKLINSKDVIINNILTTSIVFILGISVIGIVIILIIYFFKIFIFSFELISLLINLKLKGIIVILLYLIPNIINIIIYFIICYYASNYSIFLIKNLFFNKKYNMYKITKKYFVIYMMCLLFITISALLELFILPKLYLFK